MEPPTSHFSVSSSIQLVLCLSIADYCNSFMIYLSTIFSPIPLPTTSSSFYPLVLPLIQYPPPLPSLNRTTFLLLSHPSTILLFLLLSHPLPNYLPLVLPPLHATTLPYGTSGACRNIMCAQFCAGAAEGRRHCRPVLLQQPGLVNTMVRQNILHVIKCTVEQGHG